MLTDATKKRFLEILEEHIAENGIEVTVEVEEEEPQHDLTITRHDIIRMKDGSAFHSSSTRKNESGCGHVVISKYGKELTEQHVHTSLKKNLSQSGWKNNSCAISV